MLPRWLRRALLRPYRVINRLWRNTVMLYSYWSKAARCINGCGGIAHEEEPWYPECWSCYREHSNDDMSFWVMQEIARQRIESSTNSDISSDSE